MKGSESEGMSYYKEYLTSLRNRTKRAFSNGYLEDSVGVSNKNFTFELSLNPASDESDELFLSFLFSEALGGVRTTTKLTDLSLAFSEPRQLNEKLRFRLGVGLAKLGLHDLSLKHVGLAAKPWETPLYRLRAKLVFAPVHSSIGSLAVAVSYFEKQIESILLNPIPQSASMVSVCNSFNEAALALQALPLLHVTGFSTPRCGSFLGHSPVSLPILLSEVYMSMCPERRIKLSAKQQNKHGESQQLDIVNGDSKKSTKLKIGVVGGSFDGVPGRIMIALLEELSDKYRRNLELIAMCFPTPRSAVTDRVNSLFDRHINLAPDNKAQVIDRINDANVDFLLFSDAALDARVFALAHERLARHQGILWSWGGTLGIPSIDYYFFPQLFWDLSRCPTIGNGYMLPQQYFSEQIVLLDGVPPYPRMPPITSEELRSVMKARYLVEIGNRTHIYLFPASVKHFHPEFDKVAEVILRTDPMAIIVLAIVKTGRDNLPTTHIAVRHDLMHPAMPSAVVAKLKSRLSYALRNNLERVRVLPPLDEQIFRALQKQSVVVLDPFPVGLHIGIVEAFHDGVPVLSAPDLQECTNSHAYSIGTKLEVPAYLKSEENVLPSTAEEYGVTAVRIAREYGMRKKFVANPQQFVTATASKTPQFMQIVNFVRML